MKLHTWYRGKDAADGRITTTRLIYGCMTIGGKWNAKPVTAEQRKKGFAALDTAVEQGITMFDHADIYCVGKSEQLFGEFLRENPGLRDKITIQSKCGIKFPAKPDNNHPYGLPVRYDFSYRHIVDSADGILERLGIDTLDILLLHRPDPLVEPEEVARAFSELHTSGKVRNFGVSNHSAGQMQILESAIDVPLVANQMEISLLHPDMFVYGTAINQRRPEHVMRPSDSLEYCRLHGIQLQAWSPLAKGYLTGRSPSAKQSREQQQQLQKASELVANLASDHGVRSEAIVLAWILRHPAPVLPVVGTTEPERIKASCEADSVILSHEEWYLLAEAARGMSMP